jgi:hypothetical protein
MPSQVVCENLCGARSKQRDYHPCRQPAMPNGRCRLHGGWSTGPKTPGGKLRAARANYKHGYYSNAAIEERRQIRQLLKWRDDLDRF